MFSNYLGWFLWKGQLTPKEVLKHSLKATELVNVDNVQQTLVQMEKSNSSISLRVAEQQLSIIGGTEYNSGFRDAVADRDSGIKNCKVAQILASYLSH